jgi:hypothetical protein
MAAAVDRDDRVLVMTRVVSGVIVPFLAVAFVVLFPVPTDTKRLFAWEIKPTFTAMVLGSVYIGGAYFFVRAVLAHSWRVIKGGFLPVGIFASVLGIATIAHWGKFNHHHVAFWLWAGLYFTTPFLVFATWWRNNRYAAPRTSDEVDLPRATRMIMAIAGGAAGLTGVTLFVIPRQMAEIWAWTLTPLTARVMGAVFLLGVAGLGVLAEAGWTSARVMLEVECLMLALILVAVIRAHGEFLTARPLTWLLGAGFAVTLVGSVLLYVRMYGAARRDAAGRVVDIADAQQRLGRPVG